MKHLILLVLLGLLSNGISQSEFNLEKGVVLDDVPIVKGQLENYNPSYHKDVYITYTILTPEFRNIVQKSASIQEDGSFVFNLEQKFPYQKVIYEVGNSYRGCFFAHQDLAVNIDLNELAKKKDNYASKAVVYSGADAGINQFYNQYQEYKLDKKAEVRRRKFSAMMSRTSQSEYKIKQIKDLYKELSKIDEQFYKKNGRKFAWLLEDELKSEMYADLAYIFIGKTIKEDVWNEILSHTPQVVSEISNRYYGVLALKIWSHEEREIRALSKMIYNSENDTPEEKKEVERFMLEQDRKNAGLSYDNEVYAKGLKKYIERYSSQVEDAKLALYIKKLSLIPSSKVGLVGIKGQPLDEVERKSYLDAFVPVVSEAWQQELITNEYQEEQKWIGDISELMASVRMDADPNLGKYLSLLNSGARTWESEANTIPDLLKQIRNFYKGKTLVVYIWDTECSSCIEELTKAGRTYDKIKDEPIEILTLALNKSETQEEWQRTIYETFAQGEHIYLSKKLSAEIIEYFRLPPVPCYLFFDKEGKFDPYKVQAINTLDIDEL